RGPEHLQWQHLPGDPGPHPALRLALVPGADRGGHEPLGRDDRGHLATDLIAFAPPVTGNPLAETTFPQGGTVVEFGYTLMGEQCGPIDLVDHAVRAERAGFDFAVSSDHYYPRLAEQGHSPYA